MLALAACAEPQQASTIRHFQIVVKYPSIVGGLADNSGLQVALATNLVCIWPERGVEMEEDLTARSMTM